MRAYGSKKQKFILVNVQKKYSVISSFVLVNLFIYSEKLAMMFNIEKMCMVHPPAYE